MNYKTVFIDMDRTIFDFEASEKIAFFKTFEEKVGKCSDEIYKKYHEINTMYWNKFENKEIEIDELKKKRFEDLFAFFDIKNNGESFNEKYIDFLSQTPILYDGAFELCEYLSIKYQLIVLTNGIARNQRKRLELSGIIKFFDDIIISEEVGAAKPDRKIFEAAFNKSITKNKNEIVFIGDDLNADIKGGISFGIDTIFANYYEKSLPGDVFPDFEVRNLKDIYDIL